MEFFSFPDEYRNHKHFGKERFLRYANLTDREYKFLNNHLKDIQVEYQLPCRDGIQVMIFSVEVDTLRSRELSDLCGVLSRASWRPSLFLLWQGDHGKICTAIKEDGPNGRGKVLRQISTRLFRVSNPDPYVYNVLNRLDIPFRDYTSEELIQEWFDAIELVAGVHAEPLTKEDGVVYRIENNHTPLSDGRNTIESPPFAAWYDEIIVPLMTERDRDSFGEMENEEIIIEDFSFAAIEVLRQYIENRWEYDESDEDEENLCDERLSSDGDLWPFLFANDLEEWRQRYLEVCFRYSMDHLNCILSYAALGAVYEEIHGDIESWPKGNTSIVDLETLVFYMEQV